MKILAIAPKGKEFIYDYTTAHKVSKRAAVTIRDILNHLNYKLSSGYIWYIYDIDTYDTAYVYAEEQSFSVYKNHIKERF